MTPSAQFQHSNLLAAKRLCQRRLEYDNIVYPTHKIVIRSTPAMRKLQRVILHLDIQMHQLILARDN